MRKKSELYSASEQPLVAHLVELRDRLLRIVLAVLVVFLALFSFANDLYTFLAQPLMAHLPEGASMIATEVASPFLTPFKLTLVLSVFLAMPFILFQLWAFVAPGLYQEERTLVWPLMFSSTVLFYMGVLFAYFVVFPLMFGFFTSAAPSGVTVMTDISNYLDFVLKMFFAFGLAFEVPIATILLVRVGITTREGLAAKRPYIIVVAFVIGMLLTPPDVISQTLLAVPMLLLFEAGLFFSKMFEPKEKDDEEETAENDSVAGGAPVAATQAGESVVDTDDADSSTDERHEWEDEEYRPLTDEEMEAEFDRMEEQERSLGENGEEEDPREDPQSRKEP